MTIHQQVNRSLRLKLKPRNWCFGLHPGRSIGRAHIVWHLNIVPILTIVYVRTVTTQVLCDPSTDEADESN